MRSGSGPPAPFLPPSLFPAGRAPRRPCGRSLCEKMPARIRRHRCSEGDPQTGSPSRRRLSCPSLRRGTRGIVPTAAAGRNVDVGECTHIGALEQDVLVFVEEVELQRVFVSVLADFDGSRFDVVDSAGDFVFGFAEKIPCADGAFAVSPVDQSGNGRAGLQRLRNRLVFLEHRVGFRGDFRRIVGRRVDFEHQRIALARQIDGIFIAGSRKLYPPVVGGGPQCRNSFRRRAKLLARRRSGSGSSARCFSP